MKAQSTRKSPDVTVLGGGLAGIAACLHFAKAGLSTVCIEPAPHPRQLVGESLDWSAPELLKALNLPMEGLIADRFRHTSEE